MVPVDSVRVSRDPTYSGTSRVVMTISFTGLSPSVVPPFQTDSTIVLRYSCERPYNPARKILTVWAIPLSFATTYGIEFSFFSCSYWDVSVHYVCDIHLWIRCMTVRESRDQNLFNSYPGLIAVFHALLSLLMPRHPPYALNSLITNISHSSKNVFDLLVAIDLKVWSTFQAVTTYI